MKGGKRIKIEKTAEFLVYYCVGCWYSQFK